MRIVISELVLDKLLSKHDVTAEEIGEAFKNRLMKYRRETRPKHLTNPTSLWFYGETDAGRFLKVIFIPVTHKSGIKVAQVKSAFEVQR